MMRKIGVLTSGGDAPGMNAAVMSIARSAAAYGMPLIGIKHGYNGLLRKSTSIKDDLQELYLDTVLDIADQPGTYLRTARCEEFKDPKWREIAVQTLKAMEIDGLVVIGGDGSFQGAMRLCELGIPCIGIPGTIDNDLAYTEMTLGYETAVQVCTEAIRAIRATSRSHDRPHVVECMGRHCGDIALKAACATGSEIVVVPEVPWSVEEVASRLNKQIAKGNYRSTIVLAEEYAKEFDVPTGSIVPATLFHRLDAVLRGRTHERHAVCLHHEADVRHGGSTFDGCRLHPARCAAGCQGQRLRL